MEVQGFHQGTSYMVMDLRSQKDGKQIFRMHKLHCWFKLPSKAGPACPKASSMQELFFVFFFYHSQPSRS